MDALNWLDEADGRLTRACIGFPDLSLKLWGIQKHVKHALNNDKEVDLEQVCKDTKGRMTAAMVIHHELEDHFRPVIEKWG